MKSPKFWHHRSFVSCLLSPLGWIYNSIVNARLSMVKGTKVTVPVICVGNLTVGGTGKTPTTIALVKMLRTLGFVPHVLTRGYGGNLAGIVRVDIDAHTPSQVGDEPLLIAKHAPVWRSADRVAAANRAIEDGATVLIMDDGFQNPHLYKDISLVVFEGLLGIGNGCVFPAGPLRQTLESGLKRTDGVLLLNFNDASFQRELQEIMGQAQSIFKGRIESDAVPIEGKSYLAFAGIGVPQKFFTTLEERGFHVAETLSFPDHYIYTEFDLHQLKTLAQRNGWHLITTEKDAIKLDAEFLKDVHVVHVGIRFEDDSGVRGWLSEALLSSCK